MFAKCGAWATRSFDEVAACMRRPVYTRHFKRRSSGGSNFFWIASAYFFLLVYKEQIDSCFGLVMRFWWQFDMSYFDACPGKNLNTRWPREIVDV